MSRSNLLRILIPALMLISIGAISGNAIINAPGVIPASGCQTGGLMSTDQFTSTGFSQVRTVGPEDVAPAGSWVIADEASPGTGVVGTPNCPAPMGPDMFPLRVIALKLTPTTGSWQDADIQELQLIQDNNCDALYDPGVDFVMQTRTGADLRQGGTSATFFNGPAAPLFIVGPAPGMPAACLPFAGAQAILVVVKIGPNPLSGTQFGLSLEGLASDNPGLGFPAGISTGFSSSRNQAGSSIRLQIIGGGTGGPTPTPTPTPTPSPGGNTLKSFDANSNCKMDDPEFFNMIDKWISNSVSNDLFFAGVDAWIGQTSVCAAAAASLDGVAMSMSATAQSAIFEARGQNINSTAIEVFALNGSSLYKNSASGSTLRWNLRSANGQALANGTYLYRVTVQGQDGNVLISEVKKFVLLR